MERIARLKLINSVTGIKPANLIGTTDGAGNSNLAIFSSVIHLGSNPPLLGFVTRPIGEVPRHTYENILRTNQYTINHVRPEQTEAAHYTSAKFDRETSEFARCGFTEQYVDGFAAPFVGECTFKIGMRFREVIEIKANDTIMVIGEIEHIIMDDTAMVDGDIDLQVSEAVGISGLNTYYKMEKIARYPYARVSSTPEF